MSACCTAAGLIANPPVVEQDVPRVVQK